MKKFLSALLLFMSLNLFSQNNPLSIGVGIGNQYGCYAGGRLAYVIKNKLEPSLSVGLGFFSKQVIETTFGFTFYFKGYNIGPTKFADFRLPGAISYGLNWYHVTGVINPKVVDWERNMVGHTLLFLYTVPTGSRVSHRFGLGATYVQGHPTELFVIPSFVYGINFRLPIKID